MKFIKQAESVKEISHMTLSPNRRFLAVCERHRGDQNTYIAIYDIKSLFTQHDFKEKSRHNVADLYPVGVFTGNQRDLTGNHHMAGGAPSRHIISIKFSYDSKYLGLLVSSDPQGNSDVKAIVYSWIEPTGKERK
jgi:hypothetical protein